MAGNVWEWVDQSAEPSLQAFESFARRLTPPLLRGEKWMRIRGGSWREPLPENVLYDSVLVPARYHHDSIGFRCASDVSQ
jgi:formylglycine-generating enzyme required for sulfatase activity